MKQFQREKNKLARTNETDAKDDPHHYHHHYHHLCTKQK